MIRSPLLRIIGAILIAVAVLIFLFRSAIPAMQPKPEIHSTLQGTPASKQ